MNSESSWLADGVREIERVVKAAQVVKPEIFPLPLEKKGTYGIIVPGPAGQASLIDVRTAGPRWHNEQLDDPTQLIAFITSMADRGVKPEDGAVYVSETTVTYVCSFEDRRHRATCPLIKSEPWKWLQVEQKPLSQREIIRALRITFDGALPRDSNLLTVLRNVRWKSDGSAESNIQRGKEALGRNIIREVAGFNDFPEEFALTVKVFENVAQKVTVRVALEILPDVEKFEVLAFPNQIHDGLSETLEWLRSDIAETGVPTFIGAVSRGSNDD